MNNKNKNEITYLYILHHAHTINRDLFSDKELQTACNLVIII